MCNRLFENPKNRVENGRKVARPKSRPKVSGRAGDFSATFWPSGRSCGRIQKRSPTTTLPKNKINNFFFRKQNNSKKNKTKMPKMSSIFRTVMVNHLRIFDEKIKTQISISEDRCIGGRPRKLTNDDALKTIFYVLETGCQWRNAPTPQDIGWQTVYSRYRMWSENRIFEHAFNDLVKWYLKVSPKVRNGAKDSLCVDTTYVKNVFGKRGQILGRNHTDRGRQATKVSMACDSSGTPLCFRFHPGNRNDIKTLGHLLDEGVRKLKAVNFPCQFKKLFADRGYDSAKCRDITAGVGLVPVIPKRRKKGDPPRPPGIEEHENTRYVVEQTFGIFDLFRRLKVRYDGLATSFKSFNFFAAGIIVGQRIEKQNF